MWWLGAGAAEGAGPGDAAVGVWGQGQTAVGLGVVAAPADRPAVAGVGRSGRVGDEVVDIALSGRDRAAGSGAAGVPELDEPGQAGRWVVPVVIAGFDGGRLVDHREQGGRQRRARRGEALDLVVDGDDPAAAQLGGVPGGKRSVADELAGVGGQAQCGLDRHQDDRPHSRPPPAPAPGNSRPGRAWLVRWQPAERTEAALVPARQLTEGEVRELAEQIRPVADRPSAGRWWRMSW